jgi:hypothetical protein
VEEGMIAYIFWHAAPDGFSLETYEATLLKFGTSLANARISGVLGNASYAVSHTPWLGQGGYEDWTLLDGSSVLDRLNDQATTGCMEESHHAIAQITKHGGLGALYVSWMGRRTLATTPPLFGSRGLAALNGEKHWRPYVGVRGRV